MEKTIKVAIADDHRLVREGITALLQIFKNVSVVCTAENGQELFVALKKIKVDIVLLDIKMPIMNGRQVLEKLKARYPGTKAIMISMEYDSVIIADFIGLGASAFLPKNSEVEELIKTITHVHQYGHFYNAYVSKVVSQNKNQKQDIKLMPKIDLTHKELKIVELLQSNMSNLEIAEVLSISERTIEWHRANLLRKTGMKNLAALSVWVTQRHFLTSKN